ncbi:hypothetical protein [Nonomuraea sp. NPDC003214]
MNASANTRHAQDWRTDPLINHADHAPERSLDYVASAIAGVTIYRAGCRCSTLTGPEVRDGRDLLAAYDEHMRLVQAAAHAAATP